MTINTDADVIRVIRENPRILIDALTAHPELVAEVRRVVLTDELLAMPEQLAEVVKSLAETRETQSEMLKTQEEMLKVQKAMLEEQANVRRDITALHGMYRREHEDFGRFRGAYAD